MRSGRDPTHVVRGRSPGRPAPVFLGAHSRLEFTGKGINETPTRLILFLALLPLATLVEAGRPASSSFASSLKDWSFQSLLAPEDGNPSGTLLDELSGVTATGKGVIVGIIDSGIDWRHPDFRDPSDSLRSRILSIWDTKHYLALGAASMEEGPPPPGFDYGREWRRNEIEAGLRGEIRGPARDPVLDHGTYVAGIAAGNGNADPRYRGMAPDAEIVVVTDGEESTISDALRYIFEVAEREGLPAVVNLSGGLAWGYREENLEELFREQPGRALVAAAGNVGQQQHVRFDLEETAYYTVFQTHEEVPPLWKSEEVPGRRYRWLVAYHQGPGEAWVGTGRSEEEMVWRSSHEVADLGGEPDGHPFLVEDPEYVLDSLVTATGDTLGRTAWSGHHVGENIWLQIVVENWMPEQSDWRFAAKGSGVLHVWVRSRAPSQVLDSRSIDDPYFQPYDNLYTLSYPSTSPEVISVGAFANRVPDAYENLQAGDLMPYSSRGPSLDGLLKPDLIAPSVLTAARSGDSTRYRDGFGRGGGGTSAASPVVAGAVALYFERFPRATNREVWRALTESATSDEFTGETPNFDWGYGKLDVAAFLQEPPTVVAVEPGEIRPAGFSLEQNYPNPFNGSTSISYQLPGPGAVELILYDLLGHPVRRLVSEYQGAGLHETAWDGADDEGKQVASGVYLYKLEVGDQLLSRRLVFVR